MVTSAVPIPSGNDKSLQCSGKSISIRTPCRRVIFGNTYANQDTHLPCRINQVCARGKGSVPRGRVYANYASRCATERITVLNPASFGKLVRVLFPGLKTRRLGVRGESKYHYVNFTLTEDQADLVEPEPPQPLTLPEVSSFSQSFKYVPSPCSSSLLRWPWLTVITTVLSPHQRIQSRQIKETCPRPRSRRAALSSN